MSWNSASKSSIAFRASAFNSESVKWNFSNNCLGDCWLSCGLSCSRFCKASNSWSIRFGIGVCWASSAVSLDKRNQYVLLVSSDVAFYLLHLRT